MIAEFYCKECGKQLSEDERPCSNCGCTARKICVELFDKISVTDSLKGHLKSGEKRENGKPVKEIISKGKNRVERRIIKDRRSNKTEATFIVRKDGKLHHLHDKTSGKIEIWQKEGNIYWDKDNNLYTRTTSKQDKNTEVFIDSKGKEHKFLTG